MVTECGFCDRGRIRLMPATPLKWCPHCHGTNDATNPGLRTEIDALPSGEAVIKQHGGSSVARALLFLADLLEVTRVHGVLQ